VAFQSSPLVDPDENARKNVTAWQGYNRRRWAFERDVLPADARMPFVCECTSGTCFRCIELTAREYEGAHAHDGWTAVIPGHLLEADRACVVLRNHHFWVVRLVGFG
jgi:hypothetical protein